MKIKKIEQEFTAWAGTETDNLDKAKICLMGVPFDSATSVGKGTSQGPDMLRKLSCNLGEITEDGVVLKENLLFDVGNVMLDLNWDRFFKSVEDKALELMNTDKFCLFLGGDHSVTIPLHKAFGAYQKLLNPNAKIGIIHFDAHYDLCEEFEGHIWSHACTEARSLEGVITGNDLCFLGIRTAEVSEIEVMKKNPGIKTITASEVFKKGYLKAFKEIEVYFKGYDALYFTLDIDVLDPGFAPGTGTPLPGGISNRELMEIFKLMIEKLPIKAMDIVEVSPPLDVNNITSYAALTIIQLLLGHFSKAQ